MCIRLCVCLYNVQMHKASYGEFTKTLEDSTHFTLFYDVRFFKTNYRKYQLNSVDFTFIF